MARPLRIEVPGGRFHVAARGNERKDIFREDRDRVHFLSLLGELPSRFGTVILAYVLLGQSQGARRKEFCGRHRDWGRDAALWLGRHEGRMRLMELAQRVGCDDTTVGKAVSHFRQRLTQDKQLAKWIHQLRG